MLLSDVTLDNLQTAALRALQALEGNNLYTPGPYPITVRPFATPPSVIYQAADGNTYERSMTPEIEGDALNVVLGERRQVEALTIWIPVGDALQASFSEGQGFGGYTVKSGLLFRAGNYPDKGVEVTTEDIRRIVANFPEGGVVLMSEHEESLIGLAMAEDGARVVRVWSVAGDSELHGEVQYPNWLAYGLRKFRNSVSVGLTAAKDGLRELSLVLRPRVADAAVFTQDVALAFSRSPRFSAFAASHPAEAARLVTAAQAAPAPASKDMDRPTFLQRLKARFSTLTPEQRAALTEDQIAEVVFADQPSPTPAPTQTFAVTDPAIRAEIDRIAAETATHTANFAAQTDANDGARLFLDELRAGRKTPAEECDVLEQFSLARFKDRTTQGANFSANADGSAEAALRRRLAASPQQFRFGQGALPSQAELKTTTDALGPFKDTDFPKTSEAATK